MAPWLKRQQSKVEEEPVAPEVEAARSASKEKKIPPSQRRRSQSADSFETVSESGASQSTTPSKKRHSVESTLEAKVQEPVGKLGSMGSLRKSLNSLMIIRRGSIMSSMKEPAGRPEHERPQLDIPKPTLPGIGELIGERRRSMSSTPVVWDNDGQPNPCSTLCFDRFRKAKTVQLSPCLRYATVRGQMFGGCVVGKQILKKTPSGRYFEVIVEEIDDEEILFDGKVEKRWGNGMGIGFTTHPGDHTFPKLDADSYQTYACESLPESWLVGYDGRAVLQGQARFLKGNNLPRGPFKPSDLVAGDKVGILATEEGHILVFINDEHRVLVPYAEIPWRPNLFACIDLDGCTLTVSIVDNNTEAIPNHIADTKSNVCRALHFTD